MLKNNPKGFWKIVNPQPAKSVSLRDQYDSVIPDCSAPDVLNAAFSSVFTEEPDYILPHIAFLDHPPLSELIISAAGIEKTIGSLKLSASAELIT